MNNHNCSIICPLHGPLVDLKRHCHNIYRLFVFSNPYDEPSSTSQWFQIASGIIQVNYLSDLYDNRSQWCGPALDYEDARSDFHSKLILELSRFNFIWSGFEAVVDELELPNCPHYTGKVNAVDSYLKKHYLKAFQVLECYREVIGLLKEEISSNPAYGYSNDLFLTNECVAEELIGLKVVYKIRNLLAHGAFSFNEPENYTSNKTNDIVIITLSSRVVLLTLQMLILVREPQLDFKVDKLHSLPEKESADAVEFLVKLHLKNYCFS